MEKKRFGRLSELEGNRTTPAGEGRFWCKRCNQVASAACMDDEVVEHPLVNLKVALRPQLQHLQQLGIPQLGKDLLEQLGSVLASDGSAESSMMQTALQLLQDPRLSCDFILCDGERTVGASLQLGLGEATSLKERVAKVLALVLAKEGALYKEEGPDMIEVSDDEEGEVKCDVEMMDDEELSDSTMDLNYFSRKWRHEFRQDKNALLDRIARRGVFQLTSVWGYRDPGWVLEVLERAAPTVVELELLKASRVHLVGVQSMPRLRRLYLTLGADVGEDFRAPSLPASDRRAGLRWLAVSQLQRAHREPLVSLVRAHGRTLEELHLGIGTPGDRPWPESCTGLHADLAQCHLGALRKLVLQRNRHGHFLKSTCRAQLTAIRRVLPKVEVQCTACENLAWVAF